MGVIVFADQQSADAAIAEIHSTPWIAGGSGPVKLGLRYAEATGEWRLRTIFTKPISTGS